LLDHVVEAMRAAVGSARVIGREIPDLIPDRGPLGGLWTALSEARGEWVLIAACDMPELTADLLKGLAEAAIASEADAVVAQTERGLHPLCGAYHRRLRGAAEAAVCQNSLKMHDFLSTVRIMAWPVPDARLLRNLNTPEDLLV
jgi:molybdopterin-guanine dinucleotide biosynthesis protein A